MMRVIITTSDDNAVGDYRVRLPAEALAAQGEIEIVAMDDFNLKVQQTEDGPVTVGLEGVPDADVMVLQRPTNRAIVGAIPYLQERGIAVVIDLDDDLERLPPGHTHTQFYDPKRNKVENWRWLKLGCRMADHVVVSTEALTRYGASHGRVSVLRNCIPESYLRIEADSVGRPIVGWGGTVRNHPGDLRVTFGGVAKAVTSLRAGFMVVGDGEQVKAQLALDKDPICSGIVPLDDYIRRVAKMDVGIAPLAETKFTLSKSWLKGLEYASLGVFPVASDVPEYRELQKILGDGFLPLCKPRGRNWCSAVKHQMMMSRDKSHRDALRDRASYLTIERRAYLWAEAWQEAIDHRRGKLDERAA